jgi:plasmid stabilization system protein ParE
LQWSSLALQNRNQIFDSIEQHDPVAAIKLDQRIGAQVERLCHYPASGRIGRVDGTRELAIAHTPYIAAYRISEDAVLILRMLRGSPRWPDVV